jgi:predicted nuclease of predicted toxin-antitoxin system
MRFLLDENVPRDSATTLRAQAHDVLYVPDTKLRTLPDARLIAVCNSDDRYMVTRDVGLSVPARSLKTGIILIRAPLNAIAREVNALLLEALPDLTEESLRGQIAVISPGRLRLSPLVPPKAEAG